MKNHPKTLVTPSSIGLIFLLLVIGMITYFFYYRGVSTPERATHIYIQDMDLAKVAEGDFVYSRNLFGDPSEIGSFQIICYMASGCHLETGEVFDSHHHSLGYKYQDYDGIYDVATDTIFGNVGTDTIDYNAIPETQILSANMSMSPCGENELKLDADNQKVTLSTFECDTKGAISTKPSRIFESLKTY